jgi:hypothetical protein
MMTTAPGGTATFVATFADTTAGTENLNSDSFSVAAPLTLNDADFFNTWPRALNFGDSFGPSALFTVTAPLGTAAGAYVGTFNILGGPGVNDSTILGTAQFTVNVTPEPGTLVLVSIGLGLAFLAPAAALGPIPFSRD